MLSTAAVFTIPGCASSTSTMPLSFIAEASSSLRTIVDVSGGSVVERDLTLRHVLNALLAIRERVEIRSPDTNGCSSEGKGFEDIGTAADSTVDIDLDLVQDFWTLPVNLEKGTNSGLNAQVCQLRNPIGNGDSRVQRSSAVVAEQDGVHRIV